MLFTWVIMMPSLKIRSKSEKRCWLFPFVFLHLSMVVLRCGVNVFGGAVCVWLYFRAAFRSVVEQFTLLNTWNKSWSLKLSKIYVHKKLCKLITDCNFLSYNPWISHVDIFYSIRALSKYYQNLQTFFNRTQT